MDIIEEWVNENYQPLKLAARKISGAKLEMVDELLHYTLEIFLSKEGVKDIISSGGGRFYCVKIMTNSWNSITSPFYNEYRRPTESIEGLEDIPDEKEPDILPTYLKAKNKLEKLPWYDQMLFETFVRENHTVSSLARATGIPRTSISLSINRIRKYIKNNI